MTSSWPHLPEAEPLSSSEILWPVDVVASPEWATLRVNGILWLSEIPDVDRYDFDKGMERLQALRGYFDPNMHTGFFHEGLEAYSILWVIDRIRRMQNPELREHLLSEARKIEEMILPLARKIASDRAELEKSGNMIGKLHSTDAVNVFMSEDFQECILDGLGEITLDKVKFDAMRAEACKIVAGGDEQE